MFNRDINPEWSKEELQKLSFWRSFDLAGKAIAKVEAKLHRIRAFGHYDYVEILKRLGPFETEDTLISERRKKNYETKILEGIKGFPDFYLTVLVNNKKPFVPQCSVEIHPKNDVDLKTHKALLTWLNKGLPNLTVSKVQYVVDQFCTDHAGATILFWVDRRCLHVSSRKKGRLFGKNRDQEQRVMSLMYQIGRDHRLYERGPESKKSGKDWFVKDIDRIRLEHTVSRMKLKKYGINSLDDLIENPRFAVLNLNRWRFTQLIRSEMLPGLRQSRSGKDQNSNVGFFKPESIRSRRGAENVSEYIKSYKELGKIEFRVNRAMKLFDLEWYKIPR